MPPSSALEGIVFKEGKNRFFRRFLKKRILVYDESSKCLRYYTPQRSLKGTIYLHDILVITPGRSNRDDDVFHVNTVQDTKKWIGIISRELDELRRKEQAQLRSNNILEGTYSKTRKVKSVVLNNHRIGDHREHEEGCFLFDEEQQEKMDSLASLCSLQAMKIYELAHTMEKIVQKQEDQPASENEELLWLREENRKFRLRNKILEIDRLDLRAKIEEAQIKQEQEQSTAKVQKVEKHHPVNLQVVHIEKADNGKAEVKKLKDEIKKLKDELAKTKSQLDEERLKSTMFYSSSNLRLATRTIGKSDGPFYTNNKPNNIQTDTIFSDRSYLKSQTSQATYNTFTTNTTTITTANYTPDTSSPSTPNSNPFANNNVNGHENFHSYFGNHVDHEVVNTQQNHKKEHFDQNNVTVHNTNGGTTLPAANLDFETPFNFNSEASSLDPFTSTVNNTTTQRIIADTSTTNSNDPANIFNMSVLDIKNSVMPTENGTSVSTTTTTATTTINTPTANGKGLNHTAVITDNQPNKDQSTANSVELSVKFPDDNGADREVERIANELKVEKEKVSTLTYQNIDILEELKELQANCKRYFEDLQQTKDELEDHKEINFSLESRLQEEIQKRRQLEADLQKLQSVGLTE